MTKKELRKISLTYRTLSSQMLKIDSEEEINFIQMYFDYISNTPVIFEYIQSCHKVDYDFKEIYKNNDWYEPLDLPSCQEELVDYVYQLIVYVLTSSRMLYTFGGGYTQSNKYADLIQAFMRKVIEPFVVALRNYLELELIDSDDVFVEAESTSKTIFLSYCQKDSDIADLIDEKLGQQVQGQATISRDIRDVEFHESFKHFMQSIEQHDYVITIISDSYLKSRNCMYEVLEVVKDSNFSKRLVYIVLNDDDKVYYHTMPDTKISADVYSIDGQTSYILYWKEKSDELQNQIDQLGDPVLSISQAKEKQHVQRILLDLPEFIEYIKDHKGLPLSTHIEHDFSDILRFMNLETR